MTQNLLRRVFTDNPHITSDVNVDRGSRLMRGSEQELANFVKCGQYYLQIDGFQHICVPH